MGKTIEISDETYAKIKDQLTEEGKWDISSLDDLIGKKFFFHTVTHRMVGEVVGRMGMILELKEAAWVEVEPVGCAFINLNTTTDFFPWTHNLPTRQE